MVDIRNLSKDDYAKYALLVIYAWDMCNLDQNPTSNAFDGRITTDGWTVQGIITGRDNVIATAPSARQGVPQQAAGLRQSVIRPGLDFRRYGYLASKEGMYAAVIRGTDGAEEWIDNFVFIAEQRAQFPGRVEGGFSDIYLSMQYRPLAGGPAVNLVDGIKASVGAADVLVLGHSLGSTLAECLAYQLAAAPMPAGLGGIGTDRVGAIMFASPKLGDHQFVDAFDTQVTNYIVINYEHDVVPRVPPFDITHFDLYRPLPYVYTITDETALAQVNILDKGCCHHLIDYIAMLSPLVFNQSKQTWTADEEQCAKCVLGLR
jgi:triacylglycerol lipase